MSVPSLYSSHYGLRLIRIIEHSDIQYWQHIPRSTMLEWIEVWEYQSYLVRIRVYEVTNNYAVLNASVNLLSSDDPPCSYSSVVYVYSNAEVWQSSVLYIQMITIMHAISSLINSIIWYADIVHILPERIVFNNMCLSKEVANDPENCGVTVGYTIHEHDYILSTTHYIPDMSSTINGGAMSVVRTKLLGVWRRIRTLKL